MLGGPVEEVSVRSFTRGHTLWLRSHDSCRFSSTEAMNRACSRVGEDCYRLFSNNCEHFCEWCVDGKHRSYQVERLLSRVESVIGPVFTRLFAAPSLDAGIEGEPS